MIIFSSELKEGSKLKKPIYHGNSILIEKDTILNNIVIERIKNFGIKQVEIYEEKIEENIEEVLKQEKMLKDTFTYDYNVGLEKAKSVIENLKSGKLEKEKIDGVVEDTINNLLIDKNILISLLETKKEENYIYRHSINTVTFSLVMGMSLGYTDAKLKLLGKGAFLHDVGMMKVSEKILKKEDELTASEIEEVKKHCENGIKMVGQIEKEVLEIIMFHHERMDGSGYPKGLNGDMIPEMARIIAIADVYSALTEDRSFRNKYSYYDAMKIVMQSSKNLLDHELLMKFLKFMPIYPINSYVLLSDQRIGKVVKANDNPFRPIIDVMENGKTTRIDLLQREYLNKYISGVKG